MAVGALPATDLEWLTTQRKVRVLIRPVEDTPKEAHVRVTVVLDNRVFEYRDQGPAENTGRMFEKSVHMVRKEVERYVA